uniref:AP2/ERF domain-containing protein n=1 Tax=Aegilops tauschii TaxID=37682 RepID=M8BNA1_AEGTA
MDMGLEVSSSSPSSSSVSSSPVHAAGRASLAKRPAGRTKFRETRHPVYRGVRRRGNARRWRREAANGSLTATVTEEASCGAPEESSSESDSAGSSETSEPSADAEFEVPVAVDTDMFSRLDLFPEMDLCSYYASLAEALLVDPPSTVAIIDSYWDNGDDGADVALWSY